MFSSRAPRHVLQRAACMLLAVITVSTTLMLGAISADNVAVRHYSVTITQLQ
jgi:hypothetical protein